MLSTSAISIVIAPIQIVSLDKAAIIRTTLIIPIVAFLVYYPNKLIAKLLFYGKAKFVPKQGNVCLYRHYR